MIFIEYYILKKFNFGNIPLEGVENLAILSELVTITNH